MKVFLVLCALVGAALGSALSSDILVDWEGRIVGGSNAVANQFPYQASLRTAGNAHFCGGSILSNRWVLSAAHCTIGRTPANTVTVAGTITRLTGGTTFPSARVVNHPNYNANTLANDISMVQTSAAMPMTAAINTIGITTTTTTVGVTAVASGWGQTSHPGSAPNILQFLNVQVLSLADCRARHNIVNRQRVFDSTICTFTQAGQGMCMGDSGGPLVVGNNVVGAVSWGIACAQGFPDVYARVSSFVPWINSNLNS